MKPIPTPSPVLLAYLGTQPQLAGPPRHAGPGSALVGRVTIGRDAWLGAASVVRADGHFVRAGDELVLGRGATVHIAHNVYPTLIGDRVTVGRNAVVHACEVHDGAVVGDDAVILDGSVVEAGAALESGAVVYPRTRLAGGQLYAGRPAKPVRALAPGELDARRADLLAAIAADDAARASDDGASQRAPGAFVAATATLRGDVALEADSSVWYGCALDAAGGRIVVAERANVQDNSVLRAAPGAAITIGVDSTIGHNVTLGPATIGARCLIGIGSHVAAGTVVEDDVFLAAGASTLPGQVLASGALWGGQPARVLAPLDDRKRALIAETIVTYCEYAAELARVQAAAR
jgi:carbonic anhydrase/acetyltransferase-like protein (isoleucine patch superfamily)